MFTEFRRRMAQFLYPETQEKELEVLRAINQRLREENIKFKKLREHQFTGKPHDLMREMLGLLPVNVATARGSQDDGTKSIFANMKEEEIKQLAAWGYAVYGSSWWKYAFDYALNKQAALTINRVLVDEKSSWLGCGTINGIVFLHELLEELSSIHKSVKSDEGED